MDKKAVAALLEEIAALLEMKGENVFKTLAYAKAARALLAQPGELDDIVRETALKGIKGIGEGIRERIIELHETGRLAYYDELRASIPPGIMDMLRIPGLGPKKAKAIFDALGVASVGELEYACHENRLVGLPGFGEKTQQKILENIAFLKKHAEQYLYPFALAEAERLVEPLRKSKKVVRVSVAGSLRRRKEVVKDIDIVASTEDPAAVAELFTTLPGVEMVTGKGGTKASVTLSCGIASDLRIVTDAEFPYALHHFTGSKLHNTSMRGRAKKMDLKMNEYGLFRGKAESLVPCKDEEAIFKALGLAYIPPELREDMGEIDAAGKGELPELIEEPEIRGTFHVHSRYSDGRDEVAEIAEAARKLGWQYVGLTDHSQTAAYAGGLRPDDLKRQQADIDAVNAKYKDFRIFKGAEVDILPDGTLDYPEKVLSTFDFTVCSIHSKFNMTEAEATKRIIRAMEDPHFTILGHPTGRLLLSREGYPVDMKKVIEAAAERGVVIELNSHPQRLDIDWREIKYAKDLGVKIAINPDAHNLEGLKDVRYGVGIARKGWLEKGDVLNTMTAGEVEKFLRKKRG
ncbi:MAG TPA: DNA polymerase/3'-5' exonuclease PolX [Nitrospirota bacterium]|nr:DNA polymerase/3'-5' exonuclease PolX [Nitrospirota bacterium]